MLVPKYCAQLPYLWSTQQLTSEYYASVQCRNAHPLVKDSVLNGPLRIVTGCLRPTPTNHQHILPGVQSAELCRLGATLYVAYRGSLDPDHILYDFLSVSSDARQERLRSRRPFVPAAQNLLNKLAELNIHASH